MNTDPTTDLITTDLITTDLIEERLSERELCPDELLIGQEQAFARDIARLQARRDEFVEVPCPACGREGGSFQFEKYRFTYVACEACDTLFMNPRPSPAVMDAYYGNSENYRYWARYIFPASEDSRREKLHRPRLERIVAYCEQYGVDRGTLVEVGPGFGTFCEVARSVGAFRSVIGVEPTPEMAQACRDRGVEVVELKIEDVTDEVEPADVVVSFEVIEHLFEPKQYIAQCARLLRPGGLLVLTCPNGQGFDVVHLGRHAPAIDPEHVNLFNAASLSRLVASLGFEVLETSTPGRLDAEFVRDGILAGHLDVSAVPLFQRIFLDEWDRLGWPFQQFLAQNGLSSHLWTVARRR